MTLFFLSAWMRFVVDFFHVFSGDMGIDLCGDKMGVTQKFLDGADVSPIVEQMGGE